MRIDRKKLIIFMIEKNLNVKQIASLSNVSRATISGVRSGKSCSTDTTKRIAKALGCNVTDIIEKMEG